MLVYDWVSSPVGSLKVVASDRGLAAVLWPDDPPARVRLSPLQHAPSQSLLQEAAGQLAAYFAGERTTFDLPLDPMGTPFQCDVWQALRTIPFAETRSYGQIAARVGRPQAVRAVGAANGRNPLSIIVPCHRVIGASGHLTGFAGGLGIKEQLLALERRHHALGAPSRLPQPASSQSVAAAVRLSAQDSSRSARA